MAGYIYILGNHHLNLYIGVTSDLVRRIAEHKQGTVKGHTQKYGHKILLFYEEYPSIKEAIIREKQLKKWKREWKLKLIRSKNNSYSDLYQYLI